MVKPGGTVGAGDHFAGGGAADATRVVRPGHLALALRVEPDEPVGARAVGVLFGTRCDDDADGRRARGHDPGTNLTAIHGTSRSISRRVAQVRRAFEEGAGVAMPPWETEVSRGRGPGIGCRDRMGHSA